MAERTIPSCWREVLRSYLRLAQPDSWISAVAVVFLFVLGAVGMDLARLEPLAAFLLVIAEFAVGWALGERLQDHLDRPQSWLTPGYWPVHLAMAGTLALLASTVFPIVVLALAGPTLHDPLSLCIIVFCLAMSASLTVGEGPGFLVFVLAGGMSFLTSLLARLSPLPEAVAAACVASALLRLRRSHGEEVVPDEEEVAEEESWRSVSRTGEHQRRGLVGRVLRWRAARAGEAFLWGVPNLLLGFLLLNGMVFVAFLRSVLQPSRGPLDSSLNLAWWVVLFYFTWDVTRIYLDSPMASLKGGEVLLPLERRVYVREKLIALGAMRFADLLAWSIAVTATLAIWVPTQFFHNVLWILLCLAFGGTVTFCGRIYNESLFPGDDSRRAGSRVLSAVFLVLGLGTGVSVATAGVAGTLATPSGAGAIAFSLFALVLSLFCLRSGYRRFLEIDLD